MSLNIEKRLHGTQKSSIITELFSNTIHFPIANIILELLKSGPERYIRELDMYVILFACFIQAFILGRWNHKGKNLKFIGNLIGPAVYTIVEISLEGLRFLDGYNHIAYWVFAVCIGLLQQSQTYTSAFLKDFLVILENMVRTYIVLVMYGIYEYTQPDAPDFYLFFQDESHIYFFMVITLLGLVIGFARVSADKYLDILKDTAKTMKVFSEWFLGGDILSKALDDKQALSLKRQERCVVFADIRGFTAWSENRSPEEVVGMLNGFFELSEKCWSEGNIIKIKYTGDEIMAVTADKTKTCGDVFMLAEKLAPYLQNYGLTAGFAIHSGQMVEGLIGGSRVKAFDVIGDTVNTAKRICDHSDNNRIFASDHFLEDIAADIISESAARIEAKGKSAKISVSEIREKKGGE